MKLALNQELLDSRSRPTESGCIEWTALKNANGYGVLTLWRERGGLAHRIAYALRNGPIPEGLHVLHKCDNPACINPDHLRLGDQAANMRDMADKGRASKGEERHNAVLTEEKVRAIRSDPRPVREIVAEYGIHKTHVYKLKKREIWRHVP